MKEESKKLKEGKTERKRVRKEENGIDGRRIRTRETWKITKRKKEKKNNRKQVKRRK